MHERQKSFYDRNKIIVSEKYFRRKYVDAPIEVIDDKLLRLRSNIACLESIKDSRSEATGSRAPV